MLLVKANPLLKVSSKEVIGATFWIASTGCWCLFYQIAFLLVLCQYFLLDFF
jgi:hypothetical protein